MICNQPKEKIYFWKKKIMFSGENVCGMFWEIDEVKKDIWLYILRFTIKNGFIHWCYYEKHFIPRHTLLKAAISTDWTNSSNASILSTTSSTEVFSSSHVKPTISLKIPKATGSFLY